jgi:hypothetical protein
MVPYLHLVHPNLQISYVCSQFPSECRIVLMPPSSLSNHRSRTAPPPKKKKNFL